MVICSECHCPIEEGAKTFICSRGSSHWDRGTCVSLLLDEITALRSAESQEMDALRKRLQSIEEWVRVLRQLRYDPSPEAPELMRATVMRMWEELYPTIKTGT